MWTNYGLGMKGVSMDIKRYDFDYRIAEVMPILEEKQLYGTKALIRDLKRVVDEIEEIRNKTIYEFAEMLKEKYEEHNFDLCLRQNDYYSYSNSCMLFESYIDEIAEQLKEIRNED